MARTKMAVKKAPTARKTLTDKPAGKAPVKSPAGVKKKRRYKPGSRLKFY